jgi:glutathione S-transferase
VSSSPIRATLYNAPPSYYSQIARLALAEGGIDYESVVIDIHRRRQNVEPAYVRLNPNMTIPTLVLPDKTLTESRDILDFALGAASGEAKAWVDRQYAYMIEELTFGKLTSWNPIARKMIPRTMASQEARLRELAAQNPDLSEAYLRRAEVFARRHRTFDAEKAAGLWTERLGEAREHLDALERTLADGRSTLVTSGYGPADVVWTVFLGRMRFIHLHEEIEKRPAVMRYTEAMFARPSFAKADVWTSIELLKLLHMWFD